MNDEIAIVGGGLSGLSLAYFLEKENIRTTLIEASNRIGGRIKTIHGKKQTPLELGATWFSEEHFHLIQLLKELNIDKYPQFRAGTSLFHTNNNKSPQAFEVPENEPITYRIEGGTEKLIHALHNQLKHTKVILNSVVTEVIQNQKEIQITTKKGEKIKAAKVVVCIPPQLIASNIHFSPSLPTKLNALLPKVQTWMAGSIKFVIEYNTAFWRNKKYSGMLFSHVGIVTEMYDHTNKQENKFGFTGFLHPNAQQLSKKQRQAQVLTYISAFFGDEAVDCLLYEDEIWNNTNLIGHLPLERQAHFNNGDALLKKSYFDDKLFFAGTETSSEFPGYMTSAISSAKRVFNKLINNM